jgi:hypothetical protein
VQLSYRFLRLVLESTTEKRRFFFSRDRRVLGKATLVTKSGLKACLFFNGESTIDQLRDTDILRGSQELIRSAARTHTVKSSITLDRFVNEPLER